VDLLNNMGVEEMKQFLKKRRREGSYEL